MRPRASKPRKVDRKVRCGGVQVDRKPRKVDRQGQPYYIRLRLVSHNTYDPWFVVETRPFTWLEASVQTIQDYFRRILVPN